MRGNELVVRDRREIQSSVFTPRDLILVAFRRRRTIGYTFAAIMLGAVLAVLLLPAKYESETSILVHRERVDPPLTAEQTGTLQQMAPALTEEDINSEVGLLQSQDLLEKVVIACGLEDRQHPSILNTIFHMRKQTPEERRSLAVETLRRNLRIEPIKKSFLISVSYASADPQLSANVLNTLGNDYLEKHAAVRRSPGTQKFFEDEVDHYRQKLTDAHNALADFNRKEGLVTDQTEKDAAVPKLAEFEFNMRQTQAAIPQAEEHVRNLERQLSSTPPRITTELRNSDNAVLMQQLKSSLVNLELQHTDLTHKYAPTDRQVKEVEQQIDQVKTAIAAQEKAPVKEETTNENPTFALVREELVKARAELASLRALSTSYTKVGAAYQSSAIERDQKQLEQQELLRNVKTAEQNYLLYLNKKEEARISDAFDQKRIVNVSIAQAASVPAFPSNPASLVLSIAAVLGCLMGLGAAFVREQIDSSMGSPDQVEAYLNMPVLAAMPDDIPLRRLPNL
jgi:uncharacterized protein involved in exopolysaccharide biosynthesis